MRSLFRRRPAILLGAALLALGCRRDSAQPAPAAAPPVQAPSASASPTATPPETQAAGARLELGYEADATGAIPPGLESRQFAAASKFTLAVRTDDLSPGARLTVQWIDGAGTGLANDSRDVAAGARFASFASPDTAAWPTASYRVAVDIDGRPAGMLEFRVEAAGRTGS